MNAAAQHILFICSRLDLPGGIERAIVNTANLLQQQGHQVTLLVLDESDKSFYPLHPRIVLHQAALHFGITDKGNPLTRKWQFYRHVRKLRHLLKQFNPHAVIGTEAVFSITARLAVSNRETNVFAWEHHHFHHLKRSGFWQLLFQRTYPRLSGVVCLNGDEAALFEKQGCRSMVIPNFVSGVPAVTASLQEKQLLTIGWLSKTKGADLIPPIAKLVFEKHPDWRWVVVGAGEGAEGLQGFDGPLQLIAPHSPNIQHYYLQSAIYVLPSRLECFPMVLLEAMSAGLPAVAFDCPTGPKHLINNGIDGMLVEPGNITAMAAMLCRLIEDEEKRKELGRNAAGNIQRFSASKVYGLWKELLEGNSTSL